MNAEPKSNHCASFLTAAGLGLFSLIPAAAGEKRFLTGLKLFQLPDNYRVVKVDRPETKLTERAGQSASSKARARFRENLRRGWIKPIKVKKKRVVVEEDVIHPLHFDWDSPRNTFR
ncbi:MAG: hypothetical protein MI807_04370 [Verrucomicrobiales bacterium]|nr:hypothetical protein [Verrucomicrobiales bacterium]